MFLSATKLIWHGILAWVHLKIQERRRLVSVRTSFVHIQDAVGLSKPSAYS